MDSTWIGNFLWIILPISRFFSGSSDWPAIGTESSPDLRQPCGISGRKADDSARIFLGQWVVRDLEKLTGFRSGERTDCIVHHSEPCRSTRQKIWVMIRPKGRGFTPCLGNCCAVFPDDEACRQYLFDQRWPNGFLMPQIARHQASDGAADGVDLGPPLPHRVQLFAAVSGQITVDRFARGPQNALDTRC